MVLGTEDGAQVAVEFGPYRIHELLGQGGMGTVHRALDVRNGRTVALKRLSRSDVVHQLRARFRRECRIAAGLHHPHVVPVHDFGELDGQLYLDMLLVDGTDLRRELGAGPVAPERALDVLGQVAQALDAAHAAGLVHRDVKPANILLDRTGHAYLADFGIARPMSPEVTDLTGSGSLVGSWDYLAPERMAGTAEVDGRADQYSLACVLYECLTGRLPHPAPAPAGKVAGHLFEPPPAPSVLVSTITPALDGVVRRGLAKDPARRFPTATELIVAAREALYAGTTRSLGHATTHGPATSPGQGLLIRAIVATSGGRRPAPPREGRPACPYPGLRGFERGDAEWFHGRNQVVTRLLVRMADQLTDGDPIVLAGASGSGKSSVLRAGVLPALAAAGEAEAWPHVLCTPGADPVGRLAAGLAAATGADAAEAAAVIRESPAEFGALCERAAGASRLVLVVDQFEEVFTHEQADVDRSAFATALTHAGPALVVLAVRADMLQRCIELPPLLPALAAPVLLGPMNPTELREAIAAPARDAGIEIEPGLPERLIADLGAGAGDAYEPGALPRLAHALRETWNHGDGTALTLESYRLAGGIDGAVARTAEHVYAALDEPGRRMARELLLRLLVVPEDGVVARRRVDADVVAEVDGGAGVLSRLVAARLVTMDESGAQLAHEALLSAWPRLRDWIERDRADLAQHRRFAEAVQSWTASGRQPDDLYRGARLAAVNAWHETAGPRAPLPATEQEFLDRSNAADRAGLAHARRRTRRLRALVAALSVLVVLAGVAVVVANGLRRDALDAGQRNLSRQLAASAALAVDVDPRRTALLALGGWRAAPTTEARSQLLGAAADAYSGTMAPSHRDSVTSVALSDDGAVAATGGDDGTLRVWDVATRRETRRLGDVRGGRYRFVSMSGDGRLLAAAEQRGKVVTLWSVADGRPLFRAPEPAVGTAVAPDGATFVTLIDGPRVTVVVRDTATFAELARFTVGPSVRAAYSPDGRLLATTDGERIDLTRVADGARVATLAGHTGMVTSIDFDHAGTCLVSAAADRSLRIWDVAAGTATRVLTPSAVPFAVAFQRDDRLVTGDGDAGLYGWDATNGVGLGRARGPGRGTAAVAASADGHTVVGAGLDGTVTVWDLDRRSLTFSDQVVLAVAPQPRGPLLAVVAGDGSGWLWDRVAGDRPRRLVGSEGRLLDARFSPDGSRLATVGDDGTLLLWDPAAGRPVARFARPGLTRPAVAYGPDGSTIAVAGQRDGDEGEVLVLGSADLVPRLTRAAAPNGVAYSPDGRLLAVPLSSGRVELWDLTDAAAPPRGIDAHVGAAFDAAFSPDGATLATAGNDRSVRLWNVADGRPIGSVEGVAAVRAVAFSPDGATLAAASAEKALRLWDVPTRQPLAVLDRHYGDVNRVVFDDRGRLISAGADGVAIVWDLDPAHAAGELCAVLDPATIPEQWRALGPDVGAAPGCPD